MESPLSAQRAHSAFLPGALGKISWQHRGRAHVELLSVSFVSQAQTALWRASHSYLICPGESAECSPDPLAMPGGHILGASAAHTERQESQVSGLVLVKVWPPRLWGHLWPARPQLWICANTDVYFPKAAVSNLASTPLARSHVCSVGVLASFRKSSPPGKFPRPGLHSLLDLSPLSKAHFSTFPKTAPSLPHLQSCPPQCLL